MSCVIQKEKGGIMHRAKNSSSLSFIFLILFFFFSFIKPCLVFAAAEKPEGLSDSNQKLIMMYQQRLMSIDMEIQELRENLAWQNLKIKEVAFSHRPLPESIYASVQYKKVKLNALEKEKAYCMNQLSGLRKPEEPSVISSPMSESETLPDDLVKKLQTRIKEANLSDWVVIEQDSQGPHSCRLKTVLPILFASGSAVLFKEYDTFLKNFASVIKDLNAQIIVDGYADIDPIHTKRYPSNFELGATRAANVVHALVKYGVSPSIFKISSTGKYRFLPLKMSSNKTLERYVNITVFVSA